MSHTTNWAIQVLNDGTFCACGKSCSQEELERNGGVCEECR